MINNEISLKPTLELDFSNKDAFEKAVKAKKIIGNVEINNIINHVNDSPFALEFLLKELFLKIDILQNKIDNLEKSNSNNIHFAESLTKLKIQKQKIIFTFEKCKECKKLYEPTVDSWEKELIYLLQEKENILWNGKSQSEIQLDNNISKCEEELHKLKYWLNTDYLCETHKNLSEKLVFINIKLNNYLKK